MNIKKILVISLLAVLLVGCISTVSAGWFDFLSGTTEINGVEFKIPDGYSENDTGDTNTTSADHGSKRFSNDGDHIRIEVYNNSDNSRKLPNKGDSVLFGGVMSPSLDSAKIISNVTWEEKEIGGHKGMFGVQHLQNRMPFEFDYIDGDKYIEIYVNDQSVLDKLFETK